MNKTKKTAEKDKSSTKIKPPEREERKRGNRSKHKILLCISAWTSKVLTSRGRQSLDRTNNKITATGL